MAATQPFTSIYLCRRKRTFERVKFELFRAARSTASCYLVHGMPTHSINRAYYNLIVCWAQTDSSSQEYMHKHLHCLSRVNTCNNEGELRTQERTQTPPPAVVVCSPWPLLVFPPRACSGDAMPDDQGEGAKKMRQARVACIHRSQQAKYVAKYRRVICQVQRFN